MWTMERYHMGQVIWIKELNRKGFIITKSNKRQNYWFIASQREDVPVTEIMEIEERSFKPYQSIHCWNCGMYLNSAEHVTCEECGWVVCPVCHVCRQEQCEPAGVRIYRKPGIPEESKLLWVDFEVDEDICI